MTKLKLSRRPGPSSGSDAVAILVRENLRLTETGMSLDVRLKGALSQILKTESFRIRRGNTLVFYTGEKRIGRVVLVAAPILDDRLDCLRQAAYSAARCAGRKKLKGLTIAFDPAEEDEVQACAEGALLACYQYDEFKTGENGKLLLKTLTVCAGENHAEALRRASIFASATTYVRDLVNEPPNKLNPLRFVALAKQIADKDSLALKIFEPDQLQKMGAGSFMSVGKGSEIQGRMIHLSYKPRGKAKTHVALVGKGLTFDSGGLSLKSETGMEHMKSDMAGAAIVLACVRAAKQLQLPVQVTGIVMATENMPDGGANRPGDVVRAMNGKTIEITNTDAEGRLALADGLGYAQGLSPDYLIDLATLTGAQAVALGRLIGAAMGNDQKMIGRLIQAGEESGETLWQLPLYDRYRELFRSDIADMKNSTGVTEAGSITAGLFLSEFVTHKHWVHLDIAGPSWQDREWSVHPRQASGFGARAILTFLCRI